MADARLLTPAKTNLVLKATGGGAYLFYDKLEERLPGVIVQKEDEMDCLITGKGKHLSILFFTCANLFLHETQV